MMQNIAEKNGWHKFISMQGLHNLISREEERYAFSNISVSFLSTVTVLTCVCPCASVR